MVKVRVFLADMNIQASRTSAHISLIHIFISLDWGRFPLLLGRGITSASDRQIRGSLVFDLDFDFL